MVLNSWVGDRPAPLWLIEIAYIAFPCHLVCGGAVIAGQLPCVFVRASRSLIECCHTGLSQPGEALAFLHGLPASLGLHEIVLMSVGLLEDPICVPSFRAEAGLHFHCRSAPVWLIVDESIDIAYSLRVLVESRSQRQWGGVWRAGLARCARST